MQYKKDKRVRLALARLSRVGPLLLPLSLAGGSLAISPASAFAQGTTATLSGTVSDPTGALIPGAEVALTNVGSGAKRTDKANSDGNFVFAAVPSGNYDVRVTMPGFEATLLHNIHLDPSDNKNLTKVVLAIGRSDADDQYQPRRCRPDQQR